MRSSARRRVEFLRYTYGDRRQDPGTPHLHRDRGDGGFATLGFILVGDGPARALGRAAEHVVAVTLVDLDDPPVDLEGEVVSLRLKGVQLVEDVFNGGAVPV